MTAACNAMFQLTAGNNDNKHRFISAGTLQLLEGLILDPSTADETRSQATEAHRYLIGTT
jgi:hypothetical protein